MAELLEEVVGATIQGDENNISIYLSSSIVIDRCLQSQDN